SSSIAGSQQHGGKKRINGPPPQPTLPAVRQAILEFIAPLPPQRCPHRRKRICDDQQHEEICPKKGNLNSIQRPQASAPKSFDQGLSGVSEGERARLNQ